MSNVPEPVKVWSVVEICDLFQQFKPVPENYVTEAHYAALRTRLEAVEKEQFNDKARLIVFEQESIQITASLQDDEIPETDPCSVNVEDVRTLRQRLAQVEQALRLHLAIAPNDPLLINPVEREVVRLRDRVQVLEAALTKLSTLGGGRSEGNCIAQEALRRQALTPARVQPLVELPPTPQVD